MYKLYSLLAILAILSYDYSYALCCYYVHDPAPKEFNKQFFNYTDLTFPYERIEYYNVESSNTFMTLAIDFSFGKDMIIQSMKFKNENLVMENRFSLIDDQVKRIVSTYSNKTEHNITQNFKLVSDLYYNADGKLDYANEHWQVNRKRSSREFIKNIKFNLFDSELIHVKDHRYDNNGSDTYVLYNEFGLQSHLVLDKYYGNNSVELLKSSKIADIIDVSKLLEDSLNYALYERELIEIKDLDEIDKLMPKTCDTKNHLFSFLIKYKNSVEIIRFDHDYHKNSSTCSLEIYDKIIYTYNDDGLLIKEENYFYHNEDRRSLQYMIQYFPRHKNLAKVRNDLDDSNYFTFTQYGQQEVVITNPFNTIGQIRLVDLEGKIIDLKLKPGNNSINIARLNKGAYILQVLGEGKHEVYKFLR